jgi:hypothetical protein
MANLTPRRRVSPARSSWLTGVMSSVSHPYDYATTAAGQALGWVHFEALCVSLAHGGLTAFTRMPRRASSAAALTKPSTPAFTKLMAPLLGIGERARRLLSVTPLHGLCWP